MRWFAWISSEYSLNTPVNALSHFTIEYVYELKTHQFAHFHFNSAYYFRFDESPWKYALCWMDQGRNNVVFVSDMLAWTV